MAFDLRGRLRRPANIARGDAYARWRADSATFAPRRGVCFLQDDLVIANAPGATVRVDINSQLQSLGTLMAGASAPATTYAYQLWADTTSGLLKQRNAANSAWLARGTLAETFGLGRSSNTILGVADYGRTFSCTSSFTQTFTAAATLGDGWWCEIRNDGVGTITLDPNSTETIDSLQSLVLQPGDSCTINCNGSAFKSVGRSQWSALGKLFRGFTYVNNGANSIDIAAGAAMDATGAYWMTGAALTKDITAAWAVGSAAGMLDTGAVGNADYYLWAIGRSDTGVVDYLGSLSSTAPTMPANYDFKRLIGWFKRVAGANPAFHTYETEGGGIEMNWDAPTLDITLANTLTTSRRTDAVKVPLNFSVIADLNIVIFDATAACYSNISCPDQTDVAVDGSAAPLANAAGGSIGVYTPVNQKIRTSAAGLIAARSVLATVDTYKVVTVGFRWARRN